MQTERLGVEFVREALPRPHDLEGAVHVGGVKSVEVDGVRMRPGVLEMDAQAVALGAPDGRPRNLAVVTPCREKDPRRDLELELGGFHVVLAQCLPGRKLGHSAVIKMRQEGSRIERAPPQLTDCDHVVV